MTEQDIDEINSKRALNKELNKFTDMFFYWAAKNGFSSQDIADELGASRVVVSNWRSKCVPKIHHYAIRAYIDKVQREKENQTEGGSLV